MDWFTELKNKGFDHRSDICFSDHRDAVLFTTPNPIMEMPLFCGVLINDLYHIYCSGNMEKIINDKTDEVMWQLYPEPEWNT